MRVVGGLLRGRLLEAPAVTSTRPTTDRVRESLFNVLESLFHDQGWVYQDLAFLDAFAGSGALGIEALSRGAQSAAFIEQNRDAYKVIQKNLERFNLEKRSRTYRRNALRPGDPHEQYNVVFLDPPYEKDLCGKALSALIHCGWLKEKSLVVIEASHKEDYSAIKGFTLLDRRLYGTTQILFFARQPINNEMSAQESRNH